MTDPVQAAGRALSADVQLLSAISHNVANMSTPGFRATRAIPAFDAHAGVRTSIDQSDGALAQTARALDLALRGPGFFAIERDGATLLARGGSFRVDSEGWLVTQHGDRVLGISGPIAVPAGTLRVDGNGALHVDGAEIGQLQLTAVADPAALRPMGEGAYRYEGDTVEWKGQLVQGALEQANVDAADETIRLMETTRHAESVQRAIAIYDKAMDSGINQLGKD